MKIAVAMSGGVDSSVAAWILRQAGHEVVGFFMRNWRQEDGFCTAKKDFIDALAVAEQLDIDFEFVDFSEEYEKNVFSRFLYDLEKGLTPNPDVLCNSEIKFSLLWNFAGNLGAEALATGHYAGISHDRGGYRLLRARDPLKDQCYFLYRLGQEELSRTLFPLENLCKGDVRLLAREAGLHVEDKKESMGICFIGKRPFRAFVEKFLPVCPGPIFTIEGKRVGEHQGLHFYTIGQRQGLGIGGAGKPWYVAEKDLAGNALVVAQGKEHPILWKTALFANDLHWVYSPPLAGEKLGAKVRHGPAEAWASFFPSESGAWLIFDAPQWGLTPGQAVVLYRGEECLGGGTIAKTGLPETRGNLCLAS